MTNLNKYDKNFYKPLGVSPNASDAEVKQAYRRQLGRFHPDKGSKSIKNVKSLFNPKAGETASDYEQRIIKQRDSIVLQIREAYEVLSSERQAYDAYRAKHYNTSTEANQRKSNNNVPQTRPSQNVQKSNADAFNQQRGTGKREYKEIHIKSPKDGSYGLYAGEVANNLPDGQGTFYNAAGHMEFVGAWRSGAITKGVEYSGDATNLFVFDGEFTRQNGIRGHGVGRRFFYNPYSESFNIENVEAGDVKWICEADFSKKPVVGKIYGTLYSKYTQQFTLDDLSYRERLEYEGQIGVLVKERSDNYEYHLGQHELNNSIGKPYIYGWGKAYSGGPPHDYGNREPIWVEYEGEFVATGRPEFIGNSDKRGRGKEYDFETGNVIFEGIFDDQNRFSFKGKEFCPHTGKCKAEYDSGSQRNGFGRIYDLETGNVVFEGEFLNTYSDKGLSTVPEEDIGYSYLNGTEYDPQTGAVLRRIVYGQPEQKPGLFKRFFDLG